MTNETQEPRTLAEMHARKKAADERQAAAAARLSAKQTGAPQVPAPAAALPAAPPTPTRRAPLDPTKASVRDIIHAVADEHGVTYADIVGEGRLACVVAARRAAMGAVHKAKPHLSLPQLGRHFGNRDHTTVLHSLRELGLAQAPERRDAVAANQADESGMRQIEAIPLLETVPGKVDAAAPCFEWVDPRTLLVDARYQRDLSDQSLALIRRIVGSWSWRAYKPPIVAEVEGVLHVIDGQHTSIAAASHPEITSIPVMIVEAVRHEDRADAFVRQNRDRLRMSGQQMFFAQVAAGDPEAVAVETICREAGMRILRTKPSAPNYRPGDTMAVEALAGVLRRRSPDGLRRVVGSCAGAALAPVRAHEVRAVEALLFDPDHSGQFDESSLVALFRNLGPKADREASIFAAQHRVSTWRGLVIALARAPKWMRKPATSGASA